MDIEVTIRVGEMDVSETGQVTWDNPTTERILVTWFDSQHNAIQEALRQTEKQMKIILNQKVSI